MFQSCFFGNFPQCGFFGGFSFFHVPLREHVVNFALHVFPLQEKNVYLVVILSIDNAARTFFKDSIHSGYVILGTNIARNRGFTRAKCPGRVFPGFRNPGAPPDCNTSYKINFHLAFRV